MPYNVHHFYPDPFTTICSKACPVFVCEELKPPIVDGPMRVIPSGQLSLYFVHGVVQLSSGNPPTCQSASRSRESDNYAEICTFLAVLRSFRSSAHVDNLFPVPSFEDTSRNPLPAMSQTSTVQPCVMEPANNSKDRSLIHTEHICLIPRTTASLNLGGCS